MWKYCLISIIVREIPLDEVQYQSTTMVQVVNVNIIVCLFLMKVLQHMNTVYNNGSIFVRGLFWLYRW